MIAIGIAVAAMSGWIVFPGLERLLGIEVIVGRESVVYKPDGSYIFTNPAAMMRWVGTVAGLGLALASAGVVVLWRGSGRSGT